MMSGAHARIQAQTLGVLADVIPAGAPVALLDFPLHHNAGDALIWAGTAAYLKQLDHRVRYAAADSRYSAADLRRQHPDGPILLQGGGNFGDRWPVPQAFRERVISDFPDRTIVQLPQSIDMSASTARDIRSLYARHPALTVMLRDSRSMRAAEGLLPDVTTVYCPDLAFGYVPGRSPAPRYDIVELKRNDSESAVPDELFEAGSHRTTMTTDWSLSRWEHRLWHLQKAPSAAARRAPMAVPRSLATMIQRDYQRLSRTQLRAAERTLGRGRVVVTDRLHAAILAAMMGIPTVARDNVTGKVAAIFADYLGEFPSMALAADEQEATVLAECYVSSAVGV